MQYTSLGRGGTQVSRICLGCMSYGDTQWRDWVLDEEASLPYFKQAVDVGINFFDTADMYSLGRSEEVTGHALFKKLGLRREDIVIATKLHHPMSDAPNDRGTARKHMRHAVDASLRRLGVDYIDLYQIHRYDNLTPMEETLDALDELVRAGKVLYLGASSMAAWEFARFLYLADRHGHPRFVTMQNHLNLIYREEEREMMPLCAAEGVGVIPWSPLARGFLAGNRHREGKGETTRSKSDTFAQRLYYQESDFAVVDRLTEVAEARGASNAQVALAWILQKPGVTAPIIGATKPHHITDAAAAEAMRLSEDEIKKLEEPYRPHPILGIS